MKYNSDKPITNMREDLLGRTFFSKQLAKSIYNYDGKDGLVIGLFGKWGTGKTSIINMTEEVINNELAVNDDNNPIIMKFSPWNYSDKNDLIRIFFQNLKSEINIQGSEEFKKKVGKALKDYSALVELLAYIPATLGGAPILGIGPAKMLRSLVKSRGENMMEDVSLDETRKVLEEALIELDHKIIIVIDDIDRLTNNQIRDIFQLVKQVADFPNIIYVLSMDREVVGRALKEIHNVEGEQYLEKIVQIPFEIPELNKYKVNNILFEKLDKIIKDLSIPFSPNKYWDSIFNNSISPYINTIRDVNRLVNVFNFKYRANFNETSFEDMLAITTLEVLEPKLYKWIASNKNVVCKSTSLSREKKISNKELYSKEFKEMGINSERALECISTIFPAFKNKVDRFGYNYHSGDARGSMRVAHEKKFDLYFYFDLNDIKVPRSTINACLNQLDEVELTRNIKEINLDKNIMYFLEEVQGLVDKIPYERLSLIASVILNLQSEFLDTTNRGVLSLSVTDKAEYLVKKILEKLKTEEEKYLFINSAIENATKDNLGFLASIINSIERANGRLGSDSKIWNGHVVTPEQLEELEESYVQKIRSIVSKESILDLPNFIIIFHIWKHFDKEGVCEYLTRLFENKVNKLKFVCATSKIWHSNLGSGWKFDSEDYTEYISKEEIYNILNNMEENILKELTELEQIKLASFYLNYNNDEKVNEETALELVNKWKLEKGLDNML